MFNLKGVPTSTWVRLIVLFLLFINQAGVTLFNFVILPFAPEEIYEGVSYILTTAGTIWATWKNNSLTKEAQVADSNLDELKKGSLSAHQMPIKKPKKEMK